MILSRRSLLHGLFRLADLANMVGAFAFTALLWSRHVGLTPGELLAMRIKVTNFVLFLGLLAIWSLTMTVFGLYRSRRLSSRWSEVADVFKATSVGCLLILSAGIVFEIELVTSQFLAVFWLLVTTGTIVVRLLFRFALEQARIRGRNLRDALIIGTNRRAVRFADKLQGRRHLGYRVLGFVDEDWEGIGELERSGGERVADLASLPEFLRQNVVDEVILALPIGSYYQQSCKIVQICEEQGIRVRFLSNFFNLSFAKAKVEMVDSEPIILLHSGPPEGWASVTKRAFDIVVSATLLLLLSPLFAAVAAAIKLTSKGPIFFSQERLGLNKRRFDMLKFRSMVEDAEERLAEIEHLNEASGPVFKIEKDPRITPIGRFLRRTSIDELPQLISVLRGDMSLVGPRPLPVRDYQGFEEDWHRRRFSVRPGVTCLWQIAGRNSIPFERWMELDMEYIDQWSLWLDLKILLRTVPVVLRGTGAT